MDFKIIILFLIYISSFNILCKCLIFKFYSCLWFVVSDICDKVNYVIYDKMLFVN